MCSLLALFSLQVVQTDQPEAPEKSLDYDMVPRYVNCQVVFTASSLLPAGSRNRQLEASEKSLDYDVVPLYVNCQVVFTVTSLLPAGSRNRPARGIRIRKDSGLGCGTSICELPGCVHY